MNSFTAILLLTELLDKRKDFASFTKNSITQLVFVQNHPDFYTK